MTSPKIRAGLFTAVFAALLATSAAAQGTAPASSRQSDVRSSDQRAATESARRDSAAGRVARSSRTRLEADVIGPQAHGDAHSLIAALRPHWLSSRSPVSSVRVYRDRSPVGGAESLRSIPLDSVQRIEWLSGMDATTRFGMNHAGGAILVSTRM
jgi:hypothetical protein